MNEIMNFDGSSVSVIQINGEPLFELYSTGAALGYVVRGKSGKFYPNKARIDKVCENAEITAGLHGVNTYLTESQLYDFMLEARTDKCRSFRKWVTNEVLPAIRKDGAYVPTQSDQTTLDIQLLNARTMNANVYVNLLQHVDTKSESYKAILMACAANTAAGQLVLPLPKADFGKTYSATDIGRILGISRNKVGRIANEHGLKSDGFGEWYHDVAANGKECDNFRYNDAAIEKFREILGA